MKWDGACIHTPVLVSLRTPQIKLGPKWMQNKWDTLHTWSWSHYSSSRQSCQWPVQPQRSVLRHWHLTDPRLPHQNWGTQQPQALQLASGWLHCCPGLRRCNCCTAGGSPVWLARRRPLVRSLGGGCCEPGCEGRYRGWREAQAERWRRGWREAQTGGKGVHGAWMIAATRWPAAATRHGTCDVLPALPTSSSRFRHWNNHSVDK